MPKFEKGNTFGFKPGQSGNPKGRPKKKTTDEVMREIFAEEVANHDGNEITRQELLCRVVADKAIRQGDSTMIALLMKRLWPEVNRHELSGTLGIEQQVKDAAKELDRLLGIGSGDKDPESIEVDNPLH